MVSLQSWGLGTKVFANSVFNFLRQLGLFKRWNTACVSAQDVVIVAAPTSEPASEASRLNDFSCWGILLSRILWNTVGAFLVGLGSSRTDLTCIVG